MLVDFQNPVTYRLLEPIPKYYLRFLNIYTPIGDLSSVITLMVKHLILFLCKFFINNYFTIILRTRGFKL